MCGIAGRLNFRSDAPVDAHVIQGMCDLLAHRGPDGHGTLTDGPAGLGHRRLAILDLSAAGHQPMTTADGRLWVTFNGEIYNFLELRRDLEQLGHRFCSRTDTEVLLAGYRQYGPRLLERLRGMFAFAIWDRGTRTLFVARDRLGKKPLYYVLDQDGIAFASEPKAFLADPRFKATPNLEAISHYLSYQYVPSPLTAFNGVHKLPPAHYLMVTNGRVQIEPYWRLRYTPKRRITEDDACEEIVNRLREAVKLRLISDVPLGAFLSGGIDSSAIVALMAELGSAPVKTFSIGFDEKEYNELPYARAVASRYGTDHHEFIVRPDAQAIFPKLVWHYNEPFADSSAIPTYYLSQLTRQHVTVALNGDAGDENFAGYTRYVHGRLAGWYDSLPDGTRRLLHQVGQKLPSSSHPEALLTRCKGWLARHAMSPALRYTCGTMQFSPAFKSELCTSDFARAAGRDSCEILLDEFRRTDAPDLVEALLSADVHRYLPDALLVKVDIASMAHGLEARSPLLDHVFMEFVASLPADLKLRGTTTKYIFKRAARRLLPPQVIDRPKKGFSVPLDHWFRHELREMAYDLLLDRRTIQRGYFRAPVIKRLLDEHVRGVRSWSDQLWNLTMLELWQRKFIDTRPMIGPTTKPQVSEPAQAWAASDTRRRLAPYEQSAPAGRGPQQPWLRTS